MLHLAMAIDTQSTAEVTKKESPVVSQAKSLIDFFSTSNPLSVTPPKDINSAQNCFFIDSTDGKPEGFHQVDPKHPFARFITEDLPGSSGKPQCLVTLEFYLAEDQFSRNDEQELYNSLNNGSLHLVVEDQNQNPAQEIYDHSWPTGNNVETKIVRCSNSQDNLPVELRNILPVPFKVDGKNIQRTFTRIFSSGFFPLGESTNQSNLGKNSAIVIALDKGPLSKKS
jgi:glutamine synthetase